MTSIIDPKEKDENHVNQLLDYMAIYPNAVVRFCTSDMILCADTDASYLNKPQSRSHSAGYFYLGNLPSKCAWEHLNGPVHVKHNIFKKSASAAEAETKRCFVTGRDVIILQNTLEDMGHPFTITQVFIDNTTVTDISNNTRK